MLFFVKAQNYLFNMLTSDKIIQINKIIIFFRITNKKLQLVYTQIFNGDIYVFFAIFLDIFIIPNLGVSREISGFKSYLQYSNLPFSLSIISSFLSDFSINPMI